MALADSLVHLVRSLTKSEKRAFRLECMETGENCAKANYTALFDIIESSSDGDVRTIREEFEKDHKGVFSSAVSYLYRSLLDVLFRLRSNRDRSIDLYNRIAKANILFEKALVQEALDMLASVREEAARCECYEILLVASRLELEFLSFMNMPGVTEAELLERQFKVNEALKHVQAVYEQSALYELLKHRIIHKGDVRSSEQMAAMNDLVFQEHSIFISSRDSLEARKMHLLFQSYYFMTVGDRRTASQTFYELDTLFQGNTQFSENFFLYYISVIEGILANLRSLRKFEEMSYFMKRLDGLAAQSGYFKGYLMTLSALYRLLYFLDGGDYELAYEQIRGSEYLSPDKGGGSNLFFKAEITLYSALAHIGLGNYRKAGKILADGILNGDNIYGQPIYRTFRLTRLLVHYSLSDMEYVHSEIRSMKREFAKGGRALRIEKLIVDLIGGDRLRGLRVSEREKLWAQIEPGLCEIRGDVFEMQLLKVFDFTAYLESRIRRSSLSEAVRRNLPAYSQE